MTTTDSQLAQDSTDSIAAERRLRAPVLLAFGARLPDSGGEAFGRRHLQLLSTRLRTQPELATTVTLALTTPGDDQWTSPDFRIAGDPSNAWDDLVIGPAPLADVLDAAIGWFEELLNQDDAEREPTLGPLIMVIADEVPAEPEWDEALERSGTSASQPRVCVIARDQGGLPERDPDRILLPADTPWDAVPEAIVRRIREHVLDRV